jgi:ketosteroid isomerase-like protein
MSEQNVDIVRRIHERWVAHDSAGDLIDEQIEYVNPPYAVESGIKRGRRTLAAIRDIYPDFRFEPEQFHDVGDDVVVIGVARGTSASGVEAQWRQGYVWTVRGGRAVRFRWFSDPAEALRAAGVAEEAPEKRPSEPSD